MELEAGDLLIAPTNIPDSRFKETVLLVCQRQMGGDLALCLNKPSQHTLADLSRELDVDLNPDTPIYWGGPVSPRTIWMLHSSEWKIEGETVEIDEHWSMTSRTEMFYHLADGDRPKFYRFFHGYAAWGPGQLDAEIQGEHPWSSNHSWLVAYSPDPEWLMDLEEEHVWAAAATLSGNQAVHDWM